MAVVKDVGIVLKEIKVGESNKRLILLTQKQGKVVVFARGAGKTHSKLAPRKMAFYEFMFFDGGQFLSLNQVSGIKSFGNITSCYEAFCVCVFFLELLEKTIFVGMDAKDALRLLLLAFGKLDKCADGDSDPKLIFAAFVFKFLQFEGFEPVMDINNDCYFFGEEGFGDKGPLELNHTAWLALEYILNADINKVFSFRASGDVLLMLCRAAVLFLKANLDLEIKSLELLPFTN